MLVFGGTSGKLPRAHILGSLGIIVKKQLFPMVTHVLTLFAGLKDLGTRHFSRGKAAVVQSFADTTTLVSARVLEGGRWVGALPTQGTPTEQRDRAGAGLVSP